MSSILEFFKNNKIISILLYSTAVIYLCFSTILKSDVKVNGDGLEYILMTEALYNHATPNIVVEDIKQFKKEVKKYNAWTAFPKSEYCDIMLEFLNEIEHKHKMESVGGFSVANNSKLYSIHFFTYSLAILPIKTLLKPFNIHPVKIIYITNAVFIMVVLYFILFFFPFKAYVNIIVSTIFFYSTVQFYVLWTHPEVFAACFIFIGSALYFLKREYLGILFCSIAATQFQPLAIFIIIMILHKFYKDNYKMKSLLKLALASFCVIFPPLFYYFHFDAFNLVKEFGYLDTKFITLNRLIGFFIDPNQGLILNYPLLFPAYILFLFYLVYEKIIKRKLAFTVFDCIPIALVILVSIVSTMGNWSHGQAVSNRYVAYLGTLLLIHFIILFLKMHHLKWVKVTVIVVLCSQIYTVNFFDGIFNEVWGGYTHKFTAKYLLNNFPESYNPDPHIFYQRTIPFKPNEFYLKGVAYLDDNKVFKKAIVNKEHLDKVELGALSVDDLNKLVQNKNDQYNWVYFHESDLIEELGTQEANRFMNSFKKSD